MTDKGIFAKRSFGYHFEPITLLTPDRNAQALAFKLYGPRHSPVTKHPHHSWLLFQYIL